MEPDETLAIAPSASELPRVIGRFRVTRTLGRGGMGVVLLADDPELEREVAIKLVLPSQEVSAEARARFAREARSAARLNHPNIATIYDVGEVDGQPYLAMEYVRGESLAERLRQGPLSIDRCIAVIRQLAAALAAAHAAGVVHRDLKPGNVMVSAAGHVKLLDFGLAHGQGRGEALTKTGSMVGTPAYMSPEQVRGERVSSSSDIFSLGVLAYESLTGVSPFLRDGVYPTLAAIVTDDAPQVSARREQVPGGFAELISGCLRKDAAARPSAPAIVDAIDAGLSPEVVPSAPVMVSGRVAVLPLRNVSGSKEHDWVGIGIVDTLGHEIRRSEGTTLADVGATAALVAEGLPSASVGERLGAEWVLGGSFQVAGPMLRVACSLLHVPDREDFSCERIDGRLDDIFELQDRVVAAVRTVVETRRQKSPSGRSLPAARPRDMRAYEAYARALLEFRTSSEGGIARGEEYLRRALAFDPDYADAWAGFGASLQGRFLAEGADVLDESIAYLEKAIALDPSHAFAHAWMCQALVFQGQYPKALEYGQRAVELDPAQLDCWLFLGMAQMCTTWCLGDRELLTRALQSIERAVAIAPHYASIHHNIGVMLLLTGDLDRAEYHFRIAESLEQGGARHERWPGGEAYLGIVDLFRGELDRAEPRLRAGVAVLSKDDHIFAAAMAAVLRLGLAEIALRRGQLDQAAAEYQSLQDGLILEIPGMVHAQLRTRIGLVRVAHARGDDIREALEACRSDALSPEVLGNWGYDLIAPYTLLDVAAAYAERGEVGTTVSLLHKTINHGLTCVVRIDACWAFDPVRSHPEFQAERARMELTAKQTLGA